MVLVELGPERHVLHLQLADPDILLGQQLLKLRDVGAHPGRVWKYNSSVQSPYILVVCLDIHNNSKL